MVVAENVLLLVAGLTGRCAVARRSRLRRRSPSAAARLPFTSGGALLLFGVLVTGSVVLGRRDERGDADAAARIASIGVTRMTDVACSSVVSILVLGVVAARRGELAAVARPDAERRSAPRRTCRSAGRRPRTSPGSSQCPSGPARRRSSGAITSSSTSAKAIESRALGRRSNERARCAGSGRSAAATAGC